MPTGTDPRRPRKRAVRAPVPISPPDEEKLFEEPAAPAAPVTVPVEEPAPVVLGEDSETCEPADETTIPSSDLH